MKNIRDTLDKYNFFRNIFGQEALTPMPQQYPICKPNDVYHATKKEEILLFKSGYTRPYMCSR